MLALPLRALRLPRRLLRLLELLRRSSNGRG
jgi:hypothetical protein